MFHWRGVRKLECRLLAIGLDNTDRSQERRARAAPARFIATSSIMSFCPPTVFIRSSSTRKSGDGTPWRVDPRIPRNQRISLDADRMAIIGTTRSSATFASLRTSTPVAIHIRWQPALNTSRGARPGWNFRLGISFLLSELRSSSRRGVSAKEKRNSVSKAATTG